jgi:hypothetical protein
MQASVYNLGMDFARGNAAAAGNRRGGDKVKASHRLVASAFLVATLMLVVGAFDQTQAYSSYFNSRCQSCHNDDTPTCAGCHRHRGTLTAAADEPVYTPNQLVTVTLGHLGGLYGWIRGILYDHLGNPVDIATGPTGTGDDGLGNPIQFPVILQANAPAEAGQYIWQAAWFGSDNAGSAHIEQRVPVTIVVEFNVGVEEWPAPEAESRLRLAAHPSPIIDQGWIAYSAPAGTSVSLEILDTSGRLVRHLLSQAPGRGTVVWDARDDAGRPVQAGTYLALLTGGDETATRLILVLH